jgi:hypothetical protein
LLSEAEDAESGASIDATALAGAENGFFVEPPFLRKTDDFIKTGSGQT